MSGLAASMSNFYNTSNVSSVNDISYLNAYYLAESGVRYARMKQLAAGSNITYTLGSSGNSVNVVVDATNGTTSTGFYSFNSNLKSTRVIKDPTYKGPSTSVTTNPLSKKLMVATSSDVTGTYTGDLQASTITFNGGVNFYGSVVATSTTQTLTVTGNNWGVKDAGDSICSNSNIIITSSSYPMYESIISQGTVTIGRSLTGDIHAVGDVTISNNATITGSVYTQGKIKLNSATIAYNTYTNNVSDVVFGKNSFVKGSTLTPAGVPPPICSTTTYTLPPHEIIPPTKGKYNITGKDTITGGQITDKTNSYSSFTTNWNSQLCLDVSSGYINIFVAGDVVLNGSLYIKADASDPNCFQAKYLVDSVPESFASFASKIYMDTNGSVTCAGNQGNIGNWFGTISSKNDITFAGKNYITGGLYSSAGSIDMNNSEMSYVQSEYFSKRVN